MTLSLVYLAGALFSILFFYIQVYFLAKFDWVTLTFALVILVVCTVVPLFSQTYGLAMSSLVMPLSFTATVRACIYAVILLELHLIAWASISNNFDNTINAISCEQRVVTRFYNRLEFGFGTNDSPRKGNVTRVNLLHKDSLMLTVIKILEMLESMNSRMYSRKPVVHF